MKKQLKRGALIVLILSMTAGCMNPFDGGNGDKSGGETSGADETTVDVEIVIGGEFGASSIYDDPGLVDGQEYWVELEVFNSAGRSLAFRQMELIEGTYKASLTLQPGLLTFIVTSRVYTWETDVSDLRYFGEAEQQINAGVANSVTIATSGYDLLCSIIEINNIPSGYDFAMVGLVDAGFDLYEDIISPNRASGFSDRALTSIISEVWSAAGRAQVVPDDSKPGLYMAEALLRQGIDSSRPWQQEGTYNVFVMLQNELDFWVPGSVDVHGSFAPFNGSATFSAGGEYFGATGLLEINHYRGFHYLIAEEGGVIVDVGGIMKKYSPEDDPPAIYDSLGAMVTTEGINWMLSAAIFPKNWNVFDEDGKITPDAHPVAMGSTVVDLNHVGFDGTASLPLLMHYEDGGDVGDLRIPWTGTVGNEYDVYVLLSAVGELEPENLMYLAGEIPEGTFVPGTSVFTYNGVPHRVSVEVTGLNFYEMVQAEP